MAHPSYTAFGKALAKILIDRDTLPARYAKSLGCSTSTLSAILRGRKPVPKNWLERIAVQLKLSSPEQAELARGWAASQIQPTTKTTGETHEP